MKRSKMLKIIFEAANKTKCDGVGVTMTQADNILKAIQEAGMNPPSYETGELVADIMMGEMLEVVKEIWEPEDET